MKRHGEEGYDAMLPIPQVIPFVSASFYDVLQWMMLSARCWKIKKSVLCVLRMCVPGSSEDGRSAPCSKCSINSSFLPRKAMPKSTPIRRRSRGHEHGSIPLA